MGITSVDWLGYIAGAVVFTSFYFSDIKMVRRVNMVGAGLFVVYGLLLPNALPIVFFNFGIIVFHVYHLTQKKS